MVNLILSGCMGHMGRNVIRLCTPESGFAVSAGIDIVPGDTPFPLFSSPRECDAPGDVLVDFSYPDALTGLLELCLRRRLPGVLCVTGYTARQREEIRAAAEHIPLFQSANMSLGVSVLRDLTRRAAAALGDRFDIEIVEQHHHRKVDAPSGTALLLADAAAQSLPGETEYVCSRAARRSPRPKNEIGISSLRGGSLPGVHTVLFAGEDEVLELTHTAYSRDIFVHGALSAAAFLANAKPGLYSMEDLLG